MGILKHLARRLAALAWLLAGFLGACGAPPVHPPACAGAQLRIVEVMAQPRQAQHGAQWLELRNEGTTAALLDDLVLHVTRGKSRKAHPLHTTAELPPGGIWVVGNPPVAPEFVDFAYGPALVLPARAGSLVLACGETPLDAVHYGPQAGVPSPRRGISLTFDGQAWCHAADGPYAEGNLGSPQRPNLPCDNSQCRTADGTIRRRQAPAVGALQIHAIMPAAADAGEGVSGWVWLVVHGGEPVDLAGLQVLQRPAKRAERVWRFAAGACNTLSPGSLHRVALVRKNSPPTASRLPGPMMQKTASAWSVLDASGAPISQIEVPAIASNATWQAGGSGRPRAQR